jgi:uncharacterized protein (TIGR00290 family)
MNPNLPMNENENKAAVLWTGGKDCALSFFMAEQKGYEIECLITFVPASRNFKAHSLKVMEHQAVAMNLPIRMVEIAEPYDESYKAAIVRLQNEHSINTLITGDIAEVDELPNWIRQCCKNTTVQVWTPLWESRRKDLTDQLLRNGFKVILSCVKEPWLNESWLGRELTETSVAELQEIGVRNGLDLCGENGEYHTMVLDAPMFKSRIVLDETSHERLDEMIWLKPGKISNVQIANCKS